MVVVSKFGLLLNEGGSPGQSSEDSQNICSLLHGNNSQLIFLIDPDEESLGVIMENTSSSRPLSIETGSLKESVALFEKEMVINKLLLISFGHGCKRVVSTLKFPFKFVQSGHNIIFYVISLTFRNSWSQREIGEVSSNSDTGRDNIAFLVFSEFWAVQFGVIHVANVAVILSVSMVVLDDLVKKIIETVVSIMTSSVNTDS